MAKNTYKTNTIKNKEKEKKAGKSFRLKLKMDFLKDRRLQLAFGFFLLISSLFLFTAFLSYLFTGRADQSMIEAVPETGLKASGLETENWLGLFGAWTSHYFIYQWFGLSAFFVPPLLFIAGYWIVTRKKLLPLFSTFNFSFFFMFWISVFLGYLLLRTDGIGQWGFLSGGIGYELALLLDGMLGWGTFLLLAFCLFVFVIFYFNVTTLIGFNSKIKEGVDSIEQNLRENIEEIKKPLDAVPAMATAGGLQVEEELAEPTIDEDEEEEEWQVTKKPAPPVAETTPAKKVSTLDFEIEDRTKEAPKSAHLEEEEDSDLGFEVFESEEEDEKVVVQENYDPTLDLGSYQYPPISLLNEYDTGKIKVSEDELRANKDKIVETLTNFKIGISSIKATIGPTVTLYEIVPEPGVKISKIKNLEDDIALSLAALGIRIIAPIPGKGTIGIEVPNKNREMVSMHSVITTDKFMKSDKELPIVLGKTISNEVYVTDLAKMPHLLIAGATGQGKSVGLNVLLTSLIYKKHPSQLKFVLVDPKKVELTLFNKIERHFLAMLPDSGEAIITDTSKVVNTLNSLCIEMDNRYDLLKDAGCRNLKEYNAKFVKRKLNPEKGHRFLPYIVLVIDELADLMMTAGKEVETPIARLAQLARAIGIHLVVATQRPSVNVITGIIKANFPARLSFRVTSKIDSRTILDTGGAEQLVGQGDMLLSLGSDIIRLQCAFLDTPEVEAVCEFIGEQRGYDSAYVLPEFAGDGDESKVGEVDLAERDNLFEDAARLIVVHQQGSTSLIQRKLKLGYNRAGRLIDQLEAAGVVGPFEGSKAREVLIQDEYSLEQLLNSIAEKNSKY
ncbi:FtsK/SpoIIIE family DNA translocase [Nafulsella turpanensis]|uniref:FtsK/SpoIIIE family DNA translocase n=1 Tax=Nafulsella turpanensis TaxID=1265690 RepID=UPI00034A1B8E|nr:DNA translocase FtsK [Nafulsella turpanensis]